MRSPRSPQLLSVNMICLLIVLISVLLIAQPNPPISMNQPNAFPEAQNLREAVAVGVPLAVTAPPPVYFAPTVVFPLDEWPTSSVAIGDLNGDGRPDLVAPAFQTVRVLLGNGDGTFQPPVSYMGFGPNVTSVAIGNLNGDGHLDLVVADNLMDAVSVALGNGDGTFQSPVRYSSGGIRPMSVAIEDLNGDGHPDFVVANECENDPCATGNFAGEVSVLLGNGDGTFQAAVGYSSSGFVAQSVVIGDVNGDRHPDLVVANAGKSSYLDFIGSVSVLLGNGDGTFQAATSYSYGYSWANSVAIDDVNGDDHPDLIVPNSCGRCGNPVPGAVSVLLGNGDGTFKTFVSYTSGGHQANSVTTGDLNGDGYPDLVVTSCSTTYCSHGTVEVLLGYGDGNFQPPISYRSGGVGANPIAVADLNGDGRPDLVVANSSSSTGLGNVGVLLNRTHNASSTKLTTSGTPSPIYKPVTFTATVTPPPFPDGQMVTFYDGTNVIGKRLIASSVATLTTASLSAKTHTIKAQYPGDIFEKASWATLTQVVVGYPSTTTLRSSLNPSTFGQTVILTATVTSTAPSGPTGTVTFKNGTMILGVPVTLSTSGVATLKRTNLPAGTNSITATYGGNAETAKSTSSVLAQTVNQAVSTTAIQSSLNPSSLGQTVTFTAKVSSPTIVPTGSVIFMDGETELVTVNLASGKASYSTSTLIAGSHSMTAVYNGTSNIRGSASSVLIQRVN